MTTAARAADVAWPARADPSEYVFVDMDGTSLVHETELKQQPDGGHDGNGEKPLCEPCDDIDFVHDVLRSVSGFRRRTHCSTRRSATNSMSDSPLRKT